MKVSSGIFGFVLLLHSVITQASDVDWLIGCWESADGSSREVWVKESDGSLIGFGVAVSDSKVDFYEVLRVGVNQNAQLTYTAHPPGQAPTTFVETDATATSVVFSNAEHDYPQEIAYRLEDSGLYATISALDGENPQSFNKQRCN
jgi:hypothetical protein